MTAVAVPYSELVRWTSAPRLDERELDMMTAYEVELLLRVRLRAFLGRGLEWQQALMLAVTPEAD